MESLMTTFIEKAKTVTSTFRGNNNSTRELVGVPSVDGDIAPYFNTKTNLVSEGKVKGMVMKNTNKKELAEGLGWVYRPRLVRVRVGITQAGNQKEQSSFATRQEAIEFMQAHNQALQEGDKTVVACFESALATHNSQKLGCLAS